MSRPNKKRQETEEHHTSDATFQVFLSTKTPLTAWEVGSWEVGWSNMGATPKMVGKSPTTSGAFPKLKMIILGVYKCGKPTI